jgi:hypothetical protein
MAVSQATDAWQLFRNMLDDMTTVIEEDAENDRERLEGLAVLGRATAMALELNLDVAADAPHFYSMTTQSRFVGGPNPDGEYYLSMIDGQRSYRVSGTRGTTAYLGFQVLAGTGLTPRRMATYLSDRDLVMDSDGAFSFVMAAEEPTAAELGGNPWVAIPADSSSLVAREYFTDRQTDEPARLSIEPLESPSTPPPPTDESVAVQFTSVAWTIAKLFTLHRTVKPELLEQPNQFLTADSVELGSENTTPDNLYMIGSFRLADDEALVIELTPPETRFWSVTLESVWHECLEPRRRPSSITKARASVQPDDSVRLVIAGSDPGTDNWLDTGGRTRGFMTFRWLDNLAPPSVTTRVVPLAECNGSRAGGS